MTGPESPHAVWPAVPERPAPPPGPPAGRRGRALAIVGSILALLGSLVLGFYAVIISAFTCWESCDEGSGDWRDDPDAWQYDFELLWAIGGVALAVASVVLAATGRHRGAGLAVVATAVTFIGWWGFVSV